MNTQRRSPAARLLVVAVLAAMGVGCAPVAYQTDSEPYTSVDVVYRSYWYYPDVDSYYDPVTHIYIYHQDDRWVRARTLPARFGHDHGRHVIVRGHEGRPYAGHSRHRAEYGGHDERRDHGRRSEYGVRDQRGQHNRRDYRDDRNARPSTTRRPGNDQAVTAARRERPTDRRTGVDGRSPRHRGDASSAAEPQPRHPPRQGRETPAQAAQPATRRQGLSPAAGNDVAVHQGRRGERADGAPGDRGRRDDSARQVRNDEVRDRAGRPGERARDMPLNSEKARRSSQRERD